MAKEIERKFLVNMPLWRAMAAGTLYRQGYLSSVNERVVRVPDLCRRPHSFWSPSGNNLLATCRERDIIRFS
jgi:hypothetical protein